MIKGTIRLRDSIYMSILYVVELDSRTLMLFSAMVNI